MNERNWGQCSRKRKENIFRKEEKKSVTEKESKQREVKLRALVYFSSFFSFFLSTNKGSQRERGILWAVNGIRVAKCVCLQQWEILSAKWLKIFGFAFFFFFFFYFLWGSNLVLFPFVYYPTSLSYNGCANSFSFFKTRKLNTMEIFSTSAFLRCSLSFFLGF